MTDTDQPSSQQFLAPLAAPSFGRSQSQLLADRGLHARPIQDFTFDF